MTTYYVSRSVSLCKYNQILRPRSRSIGLATDLQICLAKCISIRYSHSHSHSQSTKSTNTNNKQQTKMTVQHCYNLLEVNKNCTDEELRLAYLEKVKTNHPDRNVSPNSAIKFTLIQEAYKQIQEQRRGESILEDMEEKRPDIDSIKHTAPQHRRYLNLDGVGFGTPSNRQRQFQQVRIAQATEAVYEHRKMQFGSEETSVALKDKAEARKIKISNLIDRTVDDLIREAMQRGDFQNLSGQGKPLDYSDHNPLVDPITHNLNKILVNNGFKPEWIMLSKEIRDDIALARERMAVMREMLGTPPYEDVDQVRWDAHLKKFKESILEINQKINRFNFMVPFMEKQMVHYNWEKNMQKVLSDHKKFLPRDEEGNPVPVSYSPLPSDNENTDWKDVWPTIKSFFKRTRR